MWKVLYLKAEKRDGVDDVVFPGGADGRQNGRHVVNTDTEEEEEAQQMTPDVHRLVGQYEEAAHETKRFNRTTLKRVSIKIEPHKKNTT